MSWVRLDDGLDDHPKFVGLPLDAVGLWTVCLTWAHRGGRSKGEAPGFIPAALPARYGATERQTAALESAQLWEPVDGGWQIHDFASYCAPEGRREEIAEARAAAGSRGGIRSAEVRRAKYGTAAPLRGDEANPEPDGSHDEANATKQTRSPRAPVPEPVPEPVHIAVPDGTAPFLTALPDDRTLTVQREVEQVFAAWVQAGGLNGRTKLTLDRRRKIRARLAEYPLADVLDAAIGIWEHDWHREHGQTDLALALRDGAHLEKFRDVHRGLVPRGEPRKLGPIDRDMRQAMQEGRVDLDLMRRIYPEGGLA